MIDGALDALGGLPGAGRTVLEFGFQRPCEEAGRRQRLKQVMARRRQEARLGLGCGLGGASGLFEVPGQLKPGFAFRLQRGGPLLHARFKGLVGALEPFLGLAACGVVLIDAEEADHLAVLDPRLVDDLPGPPPRLALLARNVEDLAFAAERRIHVRTSKGVFLLRHIGVHRSAHGAFVDAEEVQIAAIGELELVVPIGVGEQGRQIVRIEPDGAFALLQPVMTGAQLLRGLVDQRDHFAGAHPGPADHPGHQDSRRGRADGPRQPRLGEAGDRAGGLIAGVQRPADGAGYLGHGLARIGLSQHAGEHGLDIGDACAGGGLPAGRRAAGEGVGLQPVHQPGFEERRRDDEGERVGGETGERREGERIDAGRSRRARPAIAGDQDERRPQEEAGSHAGKRARPVRPPPEQAEQERRSKLRGAGEGDQADAGEGHLAIKPELKQEGGADEQNHGEPAPDQKPAGEAPSRRRMGAQEQRRGDVVDQHGRHGERRHRHHAGCGGESADEGDEGEPVRALRQRQGQHVGVRVGSRQKPGAGERDRRRHQRHQGEIGGEGEARNRRVLRTSRLDDHHVELARQRERGEARQKRQDQEPEIDAAVEQRRGVQRGGALGVARVRPGDQRERAHRQHGRELHRAFNRNGEDEAAIAPGRIGAPLTEQDGEGGEGDRHRQAPARAARLARRDEGQGGGGAFQLERDIGNDRGQEPACGERAHGGGLAVACGEEVRDGARVVLPAESDQAAYDEEAEQKKERRAEIDGQIIPAAAGRFAHRAVEGPAGAVDAERQRIEPGAPDRARVHRFGACVAVECGREQKRHPGAQYDERRRQAQPAASPCRASFRRVGPVSLARGVPTALRQCATSVSRRCAPEADGRRGRREGSFGALEACRRPDAECCGRRRRAHRIRWRP